MTIFLNEEYGFFLVIIHRATQVTSFQCIKTKLYHDKHFVILSGIAITPSLEGEGRENWLRETLYIDDIGPQWSTPPSPDNIVAMAFLNSIYKGNFNKKDKIDKAGWAIDDIVGTDIKNGKISLKIRIAVYHSEVRLLRIGFHITAIGNLHADAECQKLIVENIYPGDNGKEIPRNTSIIFTFNIPIDKSSLNPNTFNLLRENSAKAINGKIEVIDNKTVVFVPEGVLESNTKYIATLSKEIKTTTPSP